MTTLLAGSLLLLLALTSQALSLDNLPLDEYVSMPTGLFHRSCVHRFEDAHVQSHEKGDRVLFRDGTETLHAPCPFPSIPHKQAESLSASSAAPSGSLRSPKVDIHYYSKWVAYSGYTHPTELGFLTSTWTVPAKPRSITPVLTTLFFFNGLEEQLHDTSVIIQPVLQYGFSGCGGGEDWHFASFSVSGAGRAYCGKMYRVAVGAVLRGNMTRQADGSWVTTTENLSNPKQFSTVSHTPAKPLRFACNVMEGIRVYSCGTYPSDDSSVRFTDIQVADAQGQAIDVRGQWEKTVNYHECGQDVQIEEGSGDVLILYNSRADQKKTAEPYRWI